MKKLFSKEIIIGFTVILSLTILFLGIDYLKGINLFKPANFYYVKYTNVEGLKVSAPVTINGFQVGLVRDIKYSYDNNGQMIVELSLDKQLKLPKGTTALISKDFLGTASVQLDLTKDNSFFTTGDEIPGGFAKGMLDDVNTKIMPAFTQILPKLDSIVSNLNTLTGNPALNASITRLDQITANIEQTTTVLNSVAKHQLPGTMTNISGISTNLRSVSEDLASISTTLKGLPIDSTMNSLNASTRNLSLVTKQLTTTESTLGLLLNDRGLYDHLNTTITNVDSLLIDLRLHPKRYVNFKLF